MAGVISPSMAVYVIEDATHGNFAYSNLNEGYGKVLRYGAYSDEVLAKLHWMNEELASLLREALAETDGIDLRALLAEALHMGDEGHNRNKAGSILMLKALAPVIARVAPTEAAEVKVLQFVGDNALGVLNPVMAACKAMADAAHGVEGSTLVTTMARNGTDFGIRVSGLGDEWFTAPAPTPGRSLLQRLHERRCQCRHRRFHNHRDGGYRRLRHGRRTRHCHVCGRHSTGRGSTPVWRCTRSPWPSTSTSLSRHSTFAGRQPGSISAKWWSWA